MSYSDLVDVVLEGDNKKIYKVSHYGLGVSGKTTASSPAQARTFVFNSLLEQGKLKKWDWKNKFEQAEVRELHTESKEDISRWCEIRLADKDMFERCERAWSIIRHYPHRGESQYFMCLTTDGEYVMYDEHGNDLISDRFTADAYIQAVQKWDLKNKLTPQTRETFNDLIDEL
jgi:hypothetical protein